MKYLQVFQHIQKAMQNNSIIRRKLIVKFKLLVTHGKRQNSKVAVL